jgi:YVTN family beta-propeller protein
MTREVPPSIVRRLIALAVLFLIYGVSLGAQTQPWPPAQPQPIPNLNQMLTPLPPEGPFGAQLALLNPGLADKPDWFVGYASSTAVSPDNKTLLVLTSGFNRVYPVIPVPSPGYSTADSNEYVFIYDIANQTPVLTKVVQLASSYFGIVWDPASLAKLSNGSTRYTRFYVGGSAYDLVHAISMDPVSMLWSEEAYASTRLVMNHNHLGNGLNVQPNGALAINSVVGVYPCAAGVGISTDGNTLVVANYYNDSVTVFARLPMTAQQPDTWAQLKELDLRPGKAAPAPNAFTGVPGGEYPFWVVVKGKGNTATAYVSSIRDREIDVVSLTAAPAVTARIKVAGQPNKMTLNAAQSLLYVAEDQSDTVDVIDTASNKILETIPVISPFLPAALAQPNHYTYSGANPNSVTLSPDETQLYVTDGNLNSLSVIGLGGANTNDHVIGLIPTGWYPNSVSMIPGGNGVPPYLYVASAKSPTGANPQWCYGGYGPPNSPNCFPANQYVPQLIKATLQSFPVPGPADFPRLTQQVMTNDHFSYVESAGEHSVMDAVRQGIKHVIFILKENRTFDQVLGDLPNKSDGDPRLVEFGADITPNQHALAQTFVTLDRFLASAEVSYDGWLWSTSAQAPDVVEHQYPVAYAYRATSLDADSPRNVNTAIPPVPGKDPAADVQLRQKADPFTSNDPDVLPGTTNPSAPDGPDQNGQKVGGAGYLWDAALLAGLSVGNYGFFVDGTRYNTTDWAIPVLREPFKSSTQVAFPTNVALGPFTDPYFRGFDPSLPDYWRYMEWARDFDAKYKDGRHAGRSFQDLPALTLIRLMHDHTGNFSTAIDGVNTPDLQVADNDYAVGLVVEKIAKSPFANNTLIFIVEDDAQDGGDHYDAHRTTAYVVGPYVKQGAVISTHYNTVNFIRTMEEVLNIPDLKTAKNLPRMLNLNDALAAPMSDIFTTTPGTWSFTAKVPAILYNTSLPLPPQPLGLMVPKPAHDSKYWARVTKGMDFKDADLNDDDDFNHILWKGMMGRKPYPKAPTGLDLRENRDQLLARYQKAMKKNAAQAPNQK